MAENFAVAQIASKDPYNKHHDPCPDGIHLVEGVHIVRRIHKRVHHLRTIAATSQQDAKTIVRRARAIIAKAPVSAVCRVTKMEEKFESDMHSHSLLKSVLRSCNQDAE